MNARAVLLSFAAASFASAPLGAQERSAVVTAERPSLSSNAVVLTPQVMTRWLEGAQAIRVAMQDWEAQREARTQHLMRELRAPGNQPYLACRDRLAGDSAYRTLRWRLEEAGDSAAAQVAQRRLLAASRAACGAMPRELFDPDTAVRPEPSPDFMAVAERASGFDRVTFALIAQRIIKWGYLEAHK